MILLTLFLSVIFFLWWLYQFVDWHNDIYQVTADKILDSERKPLGDEKSKSAPLENIQSLNAERRGLLGIVLNFGNIIINVGTESRFIFFNIPNPAQAQRDIFQHIRMGLRISDYSRFTFGLFVGFCNQARFFKAQGEITPDNPGC